MSWVVKSQNFLKAVKGGTETVQTCESYCMPGVCAGIVLAFISGVELFDYIVHGGGWNLRQPDMASRSGEESNPQDAINYVSWFSFKVKMLNLIDSKKSYLFYFENISCGTLKILIGKIN